MPDKCGLLFPGYGAQHVGMGKDFYDDYRVVQELFEEAGNCTGTNFVKLCFASSEKELAKPHNAYLALFVVQASLFAVMREHGFEPSLMAGWGVGYISAHYAAGVLSFPDGLYMLGKYVTFFTQMKQERDVVIVRLIGIDRRTLEELIVCHALQSQVKLAIVYRPTDCVVVGSRLAMEHLKRTCLPYAAVVRDVAFSYGLHSLCVDEFVARVRTYLEKIDCRVIRFPIINQEGMLFNAGDRMDKEAILRFFYYPIDVVSVVKQLRSCSRLVHVGMGAVTHEIIMHHLPELTFDDFYQKKDVRKICNEY